MASDKPTKKNASYNQDVINVVKERYGYTAHYIRQSIRGDRKGIVPDRLKKEYETLVSEANKAINQKTETL